MGVKESEKREKTPVTIIDGQGGQGSKPSPRRAEVFDMQNVIRNEGGQRKKLNNSGLYLDQGEKGPDSPNESKERA